MKLWQICLAGTVILALNLAWFGGLLYLGWLLVHWIVQH